MKGFRAASRCRSYDFERRHANWLKVAQFAMKHDAAELHVGSSQQHATHVAKAPQPLDAAVVGDARIIEISTGPVSLQAPAEVSEGIPLA